MGKILFPAYLLYFYFHSTLSELIVDIIKEVIAELVTEGIGGYFGLSSKRTSNFGWVDLVLSAAKKATFSDRNGCQEKR